MSKPTIYTKNPQATLQQKDLEDRSRLAFLLVAIGLLRLLLHPGLHYPSRAFVDPFPFFWEVAPEFRDNHSCLCLQLDSLKINITN